MEHVWFNGTLYVFMWNIVKYYRHVHSIQFTMVKMVSTLEPCKPRSTIIYSENLKIQLVGIGVCKRKYADTAVTPIAVFAPIRRNAGRCVMPIRRSRRLRQYADRCVYSTFTVPYGQPQIDQTTNLKQTLNKP